MQNFESFLGVKHSQLYVIWCYRYEEFEKNARQGFVKFNKGNEPLTNALRRCIVSIVRSEIGTTLQTKLLLATLEPDFYLDTPWSVTGLSERNNKLIEDYLLTGLDAKKVSEELVINSNITPWRKK